MPDTQDRTTPRRAASAGPASVFVPTDRFEPVCETGLIALATDHAIEDEMRRFLPADGSATLYTTRVPTPDDFGLETLRATERELAQAAALLVPGSKLDVIAYGCTSATAAIGEERVFAEIRRARPGVACTTPMTAADAALRRLGAKRIVLVTPYPEPVHATVVRAIEARGFAIVDHSFFGIGSDLGITQVPQSRIAETVRARVSDTMRARVSDTMRARVSDTMRARVSDTMRARVYDTVRARVYDTVRARQRDRADAVFIACTSLRTAGLIGALERELDLPVIASNHAMAWHALDLCGRKHPGGEGRLFAV